MTPTDLLLAVVLLVTGWGLGMLTVNLRRQTRRRRVRRDEEAWQTRLIQGEEATQRAEEAARQARRELAEQREAAEALDSALKGCRRRLEERGETLERERTRGKKLETQVQGMLVEQQAELVTLEETHTATKGELNAGALRIDALEGELATAQQRLQALQLELTDSETRNRNLAQQLRTLQEQQPEPTDDLTRLRGIGPTFARRLHDAGITRFEQIAGWTDADLEPVARTLEIPVARLRRLDLPAQARDLLA